jgi:ABC-type dipeptide/oligopeptide/nickel transport system permease subunit
MRFIDVLLAFPSILLALAIITVLGRSLSNVTLAVGSPIPVYTRVVRITLSLKQMDFVAAAQAQMSTWQIMWRHIVPNIIAPIIVVTTNGVAGGHHLRRSVGLLGLGEPPPLRMGYHA